MEYVLDFARAVSGGAPIRGRRRGGAGVVAQLRIAMLGIMLGLALPSLRGTDWHTLLPAGVTVELPRAGRVTWPAGEIGLPPIGKLSELVGAMLGANDAARGTADVVTTRFGRCGRGVVGDCVVDGDTFRLNGEKIRIADIDTPETHPPRCAREARAGERATERMRALLNEGPVTLEPYKRGHDRYGRRLAVVTRDGVSLGEQLVREGLARRYDGGQRRGWCGLV
ncbi:thermonuclease family protein [Sphingomonas rubra]|uniref:Nuclease homologue n=1 Tax=Sphingomonas rubra TaxID=634430 RepID=A0A1I5QLF7_9SPHN|nr:thermonuclease family protein [Sphingomonas rubra]SFP46716.1 nuclease homologue [Sphingomonas rubra]